MVLPELVVVCSQPVNLLLAVSVGGDQPHDGVLQLVVEGVARIVRGVQIVIHGSENAIQSHNMWRGINILTEPLMSVDC